MNIQPLDIVLHMLNIAVLFVLLRLLLYKPVSKFMRERAEGVERLGIEAQQAREEGERQQKACRDQLAAAEAKADELLAESQKQAEQAAARIAQEAEEAAAARLRLAEEEILQKQREEETNRQVEIADMAIALAGELLRREIKQEDHRTAIDAFFSKVS